MAESKEMPGTALMLWRVGVCSVCGGGGAAAAAGIAAAAAALAAAAANAAAANTAAAACSTVAQLQICRAVTHELRGDP